jgi:BirA family transcriptional regulator, biotin operon repressor / biotin---[acetyl-CoA-carboxylase] ligase
MNVVKKAAFPTIKWPAEAIWESVAPILPNFTVEVLPEIDSTNTELMRRAKAGQSEPTLLIAEKQTAGRGRLGREWHNLGARASDSLPALTFSLGMPLSPIDWSGLSLAVGVSIAQSLHPDIGLKWPNDLWLSKSLNDATSDRKLAGILIETCAVGDQRYVVIGVGINITQPVQHPTGQQPALRTPAACLQDLLPNITAQATLQQVMLPLVEDILLFAERGFAPYQARFNALDVLKNRKISVDGTTRLEGLGLGVNHKGELMVQTAQGQVAINSSEVSVRPL